MSRFIKPSPSANSADRLAQINSAAVTRNSSIKQQKKREEKIDFLSLFKDKIFAKPYLTISIIIVALVSPSIYAQIKNIYDSNNDNASGITSLMSAVASNDVNGVKFFAKAGSELINQKNLGGATALHIAAREGNSEIVKTLIEYGADIDSVDNENWTPLMRAAISGNKEIVDLLLTKGAKGSILNSAKESALIHATSSDCNECLSLLFGKFDFLQSMEVDSLKSQLADAFVIARNHENQVAQDIISAYLDRVSQFSKTQQQPSNNQETMISKKPYAGDVKDGLALKKPNNSSSKFKFVGKKEESADEAVEEKITITKDEAPKKDDFKEVSIETVSTDKGKVYKFVVGPAGQKIGKKSVKFIAPSKSKSEEVAAPESSIKEEVKPVKAEEKSVKTPYNPLTDSADEEVEKPVTKPVKAAKTYKFLAGPEGKKIKVKKVIKKPVLVQPEAKPAVDSSIKAVEPVAQQPAVVAPIVAAPQQAAPAAAAPSIPAPAAVPAVK